MSTELSPLTPELRARCLQGVTHVLARIKREWELQWKFKGTESLDELKLVCAVLGGTTIRDVAARFDLAECYDLSSDEALDAWRATQASAATLAAGGCHDAG